MNSIILSFNVVMPLFLLMVLGYFFKQREMLNNNALDTLNIIIYRVLLPISLFKNIYESPLDISSSTALISFTVISTLVTIVIITIVITAIIKKNDKRGVMIQGIIRGNFLLFGMEISKGLYGEQGVFLISIVMVFIMVIHNVTSVVILEMFTDSSINYRKILKSIYENNLIRAVILGVLVSVLGIKLPYFLSNTVNQVSGIATPLALIVLGGFFSFQKLYYNKVYLIITVIARLLIVPFIVMSIAVFLGFRGVDLVVILSVIGTPTAVSSFSIAKELNTDYELAGQIVAVTCVLCAFTLFIFIAVLTQLNLI